MPYRALAKEMEVIDSAIYSILPPLWASYRGCGGQTLRKYPVFPSHWSSFRAPTPVESPAPGLAPTFCWSLFVVLSWFLRPPAPLCGPRGCSGTLFRHAGAARRSRHPSLVPTLFRPLSWPFCGSQRSLPPILWSARLQLTVTLARG
jgi:hypothetical protein